MYLWSHPFDWVLTCRAAFCFSLFIMNCANCMCVCVCVCVRVCVLHWSHHGVIIKSYFIISNENMLPHETWNWLNQAWVQSSKALGFNSDLSIIWSPVCGWKMSPAISVNKGCCGHQAISLCGRPGLSTLRDSGWRRAGCWPQIAKAHIKGMISISPDSCIFPYIEKR